MWVIALLTLVNAVASNRGIIMTYRFPVGDLPINVLDVLMGIGLLATLFGNQFRMQTPQPHPLLKWILGLSAVATLGGLIGAILGGIDSRFIITATRNFLTMPLCIYLAYMLLPQQRTAVRQCYVQVAAGAGAAALIILFFRSRSAEFVGTSQIDLLRTTDYISAYAGVAAALLLYTAVSGIKLLPRSLTLALAGFCIVGQFATLSRSDWISAVLACAAVYLMLPEGKRPSALAWGFVASIALGLSLWGGLYLTSRATGQDFVKKMSARLETLLPGQQDKEAGKGKAWDTRVPAIQRELTLFAGNPLIGRGMGVQEREAKRVTREVAAGFRHNAWTATLAETGVVGMAAILTTLFGSLIVARRMVKDQTDVSTVLVGALGVTAIVYHISLGVMTGSFNTQRGAILVGVVIGVVLRMRAMQQTLLETDAELSEMDQYGEEALAYGGYPGPTQIYDYSPGAASPRREYHVVE